MASNDIHCKIFFDKPKFGIRRIRVNQTTSWLDFTKILSGIFKEAFHPGLKIQWVDEDGDRITISSQLEWEAARGSSNLLKIYISDPADELPKNSIPIPISTPPPKACFTKIFESVGPSPSTSPSTNTSSPSTSPSSMNASELQWLNDLVNILPFHIPNWLSVAIQGDILETRDNEIAIDIDLRKLNHIIHKKVLERLQAKKYDEAKLLCELGVRLDKNDHIMKYNLACIYSLLNSPKEALTTLKASIDSGYRNLSHLTKDTDFDNIRHLEGFSELVAYLQDLITPPTTTTTSSPDPASETVPAEESPVVSPKVEVAPISSTSTSSPDPASETVPAPQPSPIPITETPVVAPPRAFPREVPNIPYRAEVATLAEMGFMDTDANIEALKSCNGDITRAVETLVRKNNGLRGWIF